MLKKLIPLVVFLFLIASVAQSQTIFYGGGQMLVKGGDNHSIGGGTVIGIGQQLDDRLIIWGNVEGFKTGEGINVDNGLAGFSLLTDPLIPKLKSGIFLTVAGGVGKVEGDDKITFANLTNAGFYFNLSEDTRLWLGGGYSGTDDFDVYSIEAGLSMTLNWK